MMKMELLFSPRRRRTTQDKTRLLRILTDIETVVKSPEIIAGLISAK
jgi:hypothetical protein